MVSSEIGRRYIVLCLAVWMHLFDVRSVEALGTGPRGPPRGPPGPDGPDGSRPPGPPGPASGPGYESPTGFTCSRYGCEVGGVCRTVAGTGQLACICPPYATGNRCEKDVDECRLLIGCLNNGTCVNAYWRPYTCECLPEYEGPFCERVNGTITDPCDANPCRNGATCSRSDSNTFLPMCTCTPGWHGPTCEIYFTPVISEVFPLVGPIAGGTDLLLSGSDLYEAGRPEIHLGAMSCNTWSRTRNNTSLRCQTPSVSSYLVEVPLPISVRWGLIGFTLNLSKTFTYKKDPVIQGLEPMESIVSGGVTLTVTGLGLDAIAKPVLKISMRLDNVIIHTFRSPCTVTEPSTMLCQTPPFDIINSEGELDLSNYTRRMPSAQNSSMSGGRLDSSDLQFLIDFELDGVGRESRPVPPTGGTGQPGEPGPDGSGPTFYFKLEVYADPIIRGWTEPVFIDNTHRILEIKGKRLLRGLRSSDYVVWIGRSTCTGLGVADNLLYCKAPQQIPQPHPEHDDGPRGRLAVRVQLGRNKQPYMVGHVIYKIHFFDDPVKKWAVIGSAIALVVLLVFIAMICSSKKKNYKRPRPDEPSSIALSEYYNGQVKAI